MLGFGPIAQAPIAAYLDPNPSVRVDVVPAEPFALAGEGTVVQAGAAVTVVPAGFELGAISPSMFSEFDVSLAAPFELDAATGIDIQGGASVIVEPAGFDLEASEVEVPTGNVVNIEPAGFELGAISPSMFSEFDVSPAAEFAIEAPALSVEGGASVFVTPAAFEIDVADTNTQTGATVAVKHATRRYIGGGAIAQFPIAAMPITTERRRYRMRAAQLNARTGATAITGPANPLIVSAARLEVGARRKPVKGQILIF